jgi:hypothetical protein
MKYAIWFTLLLVGMGVGVVSTDYYFRTTFEAVSGVNWYSFNAAHDDCAKTWEENCKIFGGFAPLSQFR